MGSTSGGGPEAIMTRIRINGLWMANLLLALMIFQLYLLGHVQCSDDSAGSLDKDMEVLYRCNPNVIVRSA